MKKQFKSESKKLLDMMIHSIYTNQEIFLRELISNASDALDKLYYKSLTDTKIKIKKEDLEIRWIPDKENRTLTIKDNVFANTSLICMALSFISPSKNRTRLPLPEINSFE